ncbi:OmpA family protein [Verrucomicrobiia bacterium DG1235]|nr:OmpA family protein [Verrucomicrobiae bacterium DG1235]
MGQGYDSGTRGGSQSDSFDPRFAGGDGSTLQSRGAGFPGFEGQNLEDLIANAERNLYEPVLFQFDSSSIAPSERAKLDQVASFLKGADRVGIVLEGHCDWRGTQEYNLALGDRRAKSVENYLSTLGVNASVMQTLSQGDLQATEGASSAQMAKERKVELLIIR